MGLGTSTAATSPLVASPSFARRPGQPGGSSATWPATVPSATRARCKTHWTSRRLDRRRCHRPPPVFAARRRGPGGARGRGGRRGRGGGRGRGRAVGVRPGRAMNIRESVIVALRDAADPVRAPQQQAYMKSDLPYLGVGVPLCRRIAGAMFARHPLPDADALGGGHSRPLAQCRPPRGTLRGGRAAALPALFELARAGAASYDRGDGGHRRPVGLRGRDFRPGGGGHARLSSPPDEDHPPGMGDRRRHLEAANRHSRAAPREAGDGREAARRRDPAVPRPPGVLSAKGHRLGAPRVLQDRSGMGDGVRGRASRALHAEPARGAQAPGAPTPTEAGPRPGLRRPGLRTEAARHAAFRGAPVAPRGANRSRERLSRPGPG